MSISYNYTKYQITNDSKIVPVDLPVNKTGKDP